MQCRSSENRERSLCPDAPSATGYLLTGRSKGLSVSETCYKETLLRSTIVRVIETVVNQPRSNRSQLHEALSRLFSSQDFDPEGCRSAVENSAAIGEPVSRRLKYVMVV